MKNEARVNKGYKAKDSVYQKAKKRAIKENGTLANLIENVVTAYSYGLDIKAHKIRTGEGVHSILDVFSTNNFVVTVQN